MVVNVLNCLLNKYRQIIFINEIKDGGLKTIIVQDTLRMSLDFFVVNEITTKYILIT